MGVVQGGCPYIRDFLGLILEDLFPHMQLSFLRCCEA